MILGSASQFKTVLSAMMLAMALLGLSGCGEDRAISGKKSQESNPVGQGQDTPLPTPPATPTPTPVPTPVATPTPTPVPTPVATPTPTPVPTPVATPTPTPVPTPVATPTPTPVPTPTPTPVPAIKTVSIASPIRFVRDDAEEYVSGGQVDLASSDLEMVIEDSEQIIGLRFPYMQIPRGVSVTNSFIQFRSDRAFSTATSLRIRAQDIDDAPTLSDIPYDLSQRPLTSAQTDWNNIPAWATDEFGAAQRTPNMASVIQELINRTGWKAGNSMVFIIDGSGKRAAKTRNADPQEAPYLHIQYREVDTSVAPGTFVLEAEAFIRSTRDLHFEVDSENTSRSLYLVQPTTIANTSTPNIDASHSIQIPMTGTYSLYARVLAPSDSNDAFYAGFDGSLSRAFPSIKGSYQWVEVTRQNLSAGTHQVQFGNGEQLLQMDVFVVTPAILSDSQLNNLIVP